MNQKQPVTPPSAGMALGDVYYVLFRRKWLILGFALLGFVAAGVTYAVWRPEYMSMAELYISYIEEPKPPGQDPRDLSSPGAERGTSVLASEIEILKSFDTAKAAAAVLQPAKILAPFGGGTNLDAAAGVISGHLSAMVPKSSQNIVLTFAHPDTSVVQPVLEQVITNYFEREQVIHNGMGMFDESLNRQETMLKSRLEQTAAALADAKTTQGVVDLNAAMAAYQGQQAEIVRENDVAQADLAESVAIAEQIKKMIPNESQKPGLPPVTNSVTKPSEQTIAAYRQASQHLAELQAYESKLEEKYTTNNQLVKTNLIEIQEAEVQKHRLEQENPALMVVAPTEQGRAPENPRSMDPVAAYSSALARIEAARARIKVQSAELELLQSKGTNLNQLEATVRELERTQQMDEANLQRIEQSLNQSKIRSEDGNRISGIVVIQNPTPPAPDMKKAYQIIAGIAGGGLGLGLALAFLLEMVLDRSFKRPQEVAGKLKLPFFLAVPYLNGNGKPRLAKAGRKVKLLPAKSDAPQPPAEAKVGAAAPAPNGAVAAWDEKHALRPFHETLRDRLVAYFEMINLTHKPKLVAVTSCDEGAGVSTMASGLASSLSETGDGNVLLVNMNSEDGEAHHFYKGKLTMGIDEVLEKEKRESAMVQDNLYVVKETSNRDRLPTILPRRFGHLVSKMKASDYDYIIFDMPPVTQISVTPRLARFMDMVLLVVESGKTDRDVAQRAAALLTESRANLGVVMNKTRSYVPKRLLQEL
jgi:uncharacterized protein involved in exopolysaccharide biosynthesis/Mrp family chromosome partitioning ATPase